MIQKLLILTGCFVWSACSFAQTEKYHLKADTLPAVWSVFPIGIIKSNAYSKTSVNLPIPIQSSLITSAKSFSISPGIINYHLFPWSNHTVGNSYFPFASDYLCEGQLWKLHTLSSHTTYPFWGATTYAQFLHHHAFTDHLRLSSGIFFGKYSMLQQEDEDGNRWLMNDSPIIRKLFNDFGGILGMEYSLIDHWSLLFRIRYSLMERPNKIMPSLTPMFPHNSVEMKLQFAPVKNVKIKIGYERDLHKQK